MLYGTKSLRLAYFTQLVLGGGNARGQGLASEMPDPVRRQSHRRAVVTSHGLVARGERQRTSKRELEVLAARYQACLPDGQRMQYTPSSPQGAQTALNRSTRKAPSPRSAALSSSTVQGGSASLNRRRMNRSRRYRSPVWNAAPLMQMARRLPARQDRRRD